MKNRIHLDAFYPHSPERVWKAITEGQALSQWLMPTNFEAQKGSEFRFDSTSHSVSGVVLEVIPEKLVAFTWDDGEAGSPSVVTLRLGPSDGGTHLTLEHQAVVDVSPITMLEAAPNWSYALHFGLPMHLAGYPPVPVVYMQEEERIEIKQRAGFRQEEDECLVH